MNVIARQEFELTYYDSAVQPFNNYATRTPSLYFVLLLKWFTYSGFQLLNTFRKCRVSWSQFVVWSIGSGIFLYIFSRLSYFSSVCSSVISVDIVVTSCRNSSSFALFSLYIPPVPELLHLHNPFNALETFPPPFLDKYTVSMTFFYCKALCMIINLLVLWSVRLSFSFVIFYKSFRASYKRDFAEM